MGLKNWNSPFLNSVRGLSILWCVGLGLFSLSQHHFVTAGFDFAMALLIAAINVLLGLQQRKLAVLHDEFEARRTEIERRTAMVDQQLRDAFRKARVNLEKVVKALGAEILPHDRAFENGVTVRLSAGGSIFHIHYDMIQKCDRNEYPIRVTCYYGSVQEPWPERIATALLLLKQNPGVFDKWYKQDGFHLD